MRDRDELGLESDAEQQARAAERADRAREIAWPDDAEIVGRDSDLRDATFLARKRHAAADPLDLTPEQWARVRAHNLLPPSQRPLPCDRSTPLAFRSARCRACYRTDCDGGERCLGSSVWD